MLIANSTLCTSLAIGLSSHIQHATRLVFSCYLRVLWGEKIGYENGLWRAGCHGKRRRKNSDWRLSIQYGVRPKSDFFFRLLVMSCCRNGFFSGTSAGRQNMTVILTFDPQFTERTVQITHIVFLRMFPSQQKRNHSLDECFSSLNTKLEPAVNFDCKKCLK